MDLDIVHPADKGKRKVTKIVRKKRDYGKGKMTKIVGKKGEKRILLVNLRTPLQDISNNLKRQEKNGMKRKFVLQDEDDDDMDEVAQGDDKRIYNRV
ncbi:hypothetical protein ACH5RR_018407 [Cinchona calisaya]|uniref:Uncharacterized protein n=1 Tax=Cinchona calisaya TaxID=153742 RepID=A0ABD2ZLT8_9GENT